MTKEEIRKTIRLQRDQQPMEDLQLHSKAVIKRLIQTEAYKGCSRLFTYLSMGSEVSTYELINQAQKDGKRVFLPRVEKKLLEFYEVSDLGDLEKSKFGVLEPRISAEKRYLVPKAYLSIGEEYSDQKKSISYENLMIMPGLAFDREGNRIGYGAGFYDRYLSLVSQKDKEHFYKIAIAYDFQLVEKIPAEEFDIRVDEIITPSSRLYCHIDE